MSHPPNKPEDRRVTASTADGDVTSKLATAWIGSVPVHLTSMKEAQQIILAAADNGTEPLGVASINLDHMYHFCARDRGHKKNNAPLPETGHWLNLIDGAPIASHIRRITGQRYPKLSGSDLIEPVLDEAARLRLCVALIGGSRDMTPLLEERMHKQWSGIRFAGHWAPERYQVESPTESRRIASEIRAAEVDMVVVCLGKPRQEEWISAYGRDTGAGVLLAFGAVVDFLAGRAVRSPRWVSLIGLEWLWRLAREPKRLARRYLIQGPQAYVTLRRSNSGALPNVSN